MSLSAAWAEKDNPVHVSKMAVVINETLGNYAMSHVIASSLAAKGYGKLDPHLFNHIEHFGKSLKDFQGSLGKIIEGVKLLELTQEKAGQVLRLIDAAKEIHGI